MKEDCAPAATLTYVSRAEFEADFASDLDKAVKRTLALVAEQASVPGWHLMRHFDVARIKVSEASVPYLSSEATRRLITFAKNNSYAFDLATYIAGMNIAVLSTNGVEMNQPLTIFGAQVLAGEIKRPAQSGRPRQDAILRLWQYGFCRFLAKNAPLPLTRSVEGKKVGFSACDAVAESYARVGKHTTFPQMKSLCYDDSYQELRELAEYLNIMDYSDF